MNVWGLDPSTARIGIATASGEILSISARAGSDDPYRRLHELIRDVARTIRLRPPAPDLVVVENYASGGVSGNLAKFRAGEIGGAVRLWLWEHDVRFVSPTPSNVKRFATGNGNASKELMVSRAVELGARCNVNHDEADAFHLRRMGRAANGLEGHLQDFELDAIAASGVPW